MRKFANMTPNPRFPSVKITYAVRDAPVATPVYTISGLVTRDGTVTPGVAIEFPLIGTNTTNGSGVYSQSAVAGYTGVVIPHYSAGSFTPASRSYSSLAADATDQNYALYLPQSSEFVVLNRSGSFNLDFSVATTTGFFAVQDFFGNIVIHADGAASLSFSNESATVWPCLSATDAFRYGSIVDLQAGATQGFSGSVDIQLLVNLAQLVATAGSITDVTISSAQTQLTQVALYNNGMSSAQVNAVLIALDSTGATGGSLSITGNSAPTGGGATAKTSLQGKGWFVDTD